MIITIANNNFQNKNTSDHYNHMNQYESMALYWYMKKKEEQLFIQINGLNFFTTRLTVSRLKASNDKDMIRISWCVRMLTWKFISRIFSRCLDFPFWNRITNIFFKWSPFLQNSVVKSIERLIVLNKFQCFECLISKGFYQLWLKGLSFEGLQTSCECGWIVVLQENTK